MLNEQILGWQTYMQDTLLGGISATLVSVNELLACRERKALPDYNGLITNLVDSVALTDLCVRNYPVKSVRLYGHCKIKNFNKPVLAPIRLGKLLFGNDLPKTIQDIRSTNKVMNTVAKPMNTNGKNHSKPKPYSHGSTSDDMVVPQMTNSLKTNYSPTKRISLKKFTKY